ncbi:helix-turn-helix domain-containing protein [Exiguobacterium acetylicum]|uniref:helix-turn-helix domain-containing protein n=1 Tax=Exiguobacterium acetylicum TaxID=41170 RepID=UPI001EE2C14A|nr:helix-turn-helix domain-containing protein [Exiguobacterium acetylicum]UKS55674.1 helix-turn-helix domain-containing protein [Exiguobacterium acetylicum]
MDQFMSPQIGLALRRLRKKHNLTQKDLANGICSQAEISKIESGTHSPTVELLYALSRRLQVPMTLFLDHTNFRESLKLLDEKLLHRFRSGDFQALHFETQKIINSSPLDEELNLLVRYFYLLSSYRLEKLDYRTCIIELQQISEKYSSLYYSPSMILRIKSAIAILHFENKSYKHSRIVYEELMNLDYDSDELILEKIRIHYNYSKILLKLNEVQKSLEIVQKAINISLLNKNMSLLGQLYSQKGECQELLNHSQKEIMHSYKNALLLFDLLNMKEYTQIILDTKSHFVVLDQ